MSRSLWILPWIAQGAAMLVDELHFHRRRGLGRWERLGHPIDTIATILPYAMTWGLPYGKSTSAAFVAAAAFSCLLITKDEWVHRRECSAGEHWVHAVLFILHPLGLVAAWTVWTGESSLRWALQAQLGLMVAFFGYQTIYWNLLGERRR